MISHAYNKCYPDMSLVERILEHCERYETFDSTLLDCDNTVLYPVLLSLSNKEVISFVCNDTYFYSLTDEGKQILAEGSHEYKLYNLIPDNGIDIKQLINNTHGMINAFKYKWIRKEGDKIYKNMTEVEDVTRNMLYKISNEDLNDGDMTNEIQEMRKRRLIVKRKKTVYKISKGVMYDSQTYVTELTSKMVINKTYSDMHFKPYNFNTTGNTPQHGALHPLMKVREEIRKIFLEMGFAEMDTNTFVESSFWNFDSLFQPQHHPSRDEQDTFYMKTPCTTLDLPMEYVDKTRKMHSTGDFGSCGYMYDWDIQEARKNILRSHTTGNSMRHLYELSNKGITTAKMFSIDRVFRNEALDATHLAEFNQIEGVILGEDLTIGHIMGLFQEFYKRMGITDIRFKPTYNPYTELSMEAFGYHTQMKKWIEIGNSGMFRPEVLRPLGFDENIRCIGFGLSLERPTMIKYGITNIRDLVGHRVDIDYIRKSQFCYF